MFSAGRTTPADSPGEKRLGRRLTDDEVEAYEREALGKPMQDILRVLNAN
jgi:hypothetical protein